MGALLTEWEQKYDIKSPYVQIGQRFEYLIRQISEKTHEKVVILIDEYDAPLLGNWGAEEENDIVYAFSKFYSALKNAGHCIRFLLITGVTRFSHVSLFSGANQLKDISMNPKYEAICGITQEELDSYFSEEIVKFGKKNGLSPADAGAALKMQYDGYHFSENMTDVYNPFSIIYAFDSGKLGNFWFKSGSMTALVKAVGSVRNVNIEKQLDEYLTEGTFADYKATPENLLPLFYQSGYLTIKEVNKGALGDVGYKLGFPNNEVARAYSTLMLNTFYFKEGGCSNWVRGIRIAIQKGDTKMLRKHIRALFADIPYEARPPKGEKGERGEENYRVYEGYFHTALFLVFKLSGTYMVLNEMMNAKGRADCVIETHDFVYIWEFKLDRPASMGTRQIVERDYAGPYAADKRKMFRIAASFSSQDFTLKDWEENGVKVDLSEDDDDDW